MFGTGGVIFPPVISTSRAVSKQAGGLLQRAADGRRPFFGPQTGAEILPKADPRRIRGQDHTRGNGPVQGQPHPCRPGTWHQPYPHQSHQKCHSGGGPAYPYYFRHRPQPFTSDHACPQRSPRPCPQRFPVHPLRPAFPIIATLSDEVFYYF